MAETVRTFIAIELAPEARAFLADTQAKLRRSGGDVRWVRPDLIHLTLVFLGNVPAEMLADLEATVREAAVAFTPLALQVKGAGRFPPRGLPRVVWIGVEEPTGKLQELQKAVADATAAFAEKEEDRAYQPHLTVGRVKSPKGGRELGAAVDALAGTAGPEFVAAEVTIFRSDLSPQGPTYTALARVALAGK
jgi:2'-5' RNA ligase